MFCTDLQKKLMGVFDAMYNNVCFSVTVTLWRQTLCEVDTADQAGTSVQWAMSLSLNLYAGLQQPLVHKANNLQLVLPAHRFSEIDVVA
jgi:hypothetical protein